MDTRRTDEVEVKVGQPARAWLHPPRNLNRLMSVIALSGLFMAAVAPRPGVPTPTRPRVVPMPPFVWTVPGPVRPTAPADPFVVIPRGDIDPGFLVAAPEGIDDAMIVSADGRFATRGR